MSTVIDPAAPTPADLDHADHGDGHPTMALYWRVGLALAILTALEVSTEWWPDGWHKVAYPALIVMMMIKFVMVAAYFMHLKFDAKILRRVFTTGFVIAVAVYVATLSAMTYWNDSGTPRFDNAPSEKPIPPKPTDAPG